MADTKGDAATRCDNSCGCPSPCPGGHSCRCIASSGEGTETHMKCSCGDHCGCNPCTCAKTQVQGTKKAFCKCGSNCNCATCQA